MADLEIDVDGIDQTLREIKRDLHRGMEKSAERLVDNAKDRAREVLTAEDAIFNAEVYRSFRDVETKNNPSTVRAKLYNTADHAEPLEKGATYTTKGPPVVALLPWVARKMDWEPDTNDFDFDGDAGIPDSFGGGDDDGDDYTGDSTNSSSGISPDSNSENTPVAVRVDGPLTERNELDVDKDESDSEISERYDINRTYTEDFDKDSKSTYSRSQLAFTTEIDNDRNPKEQEIRKIEDDYIELGSGLTVNRYYFPHVTEDEKEQYDQDNINTVEEVDILGLDTRTPIADLKEGDELIIDGDQTDVSDWDDKEVFVTVDEVNWLSAGGDFTVHAKFSSTKHEIDSDAYLVAKQDNPDSWEGRNAEKGDQITFYDNIYDTIRTGYVTKEAYDGNQKAWETVKVNVIDPQNGKSKYVDSKNIIGYDSSTGYWSRDEEDVPDNDILDEEIIEDVPDSISGFEEGQRYRVWDRRNGEWFDGEVGIVHSDHATISPSGDPTSEFEYYPDRSDALDNASMFVTPVGKYQSGGSWDIGYPERDQQNLLWYGQKITYDVNGTEKTGLVSDWDEKWVYLAEAEDSKVPRVPSIDTDRRLTGGEDWQEAVKDSEKAQQLYAEIRYRINHHTDKEELIEDYAEFIRDDYFGWVKNDQVAQETVANMSSLGEPSGIGAAGAMSPGQGVEKYHFGMKVGTETDSNNDYSGFNKLTAFHELQHGILYSRGLRNDGMELAKGFTGNGPFSVGEFDEWTETVFNADGSVQTGNLDQIAIDRHGPIKDYIIRDKINDEYIGETDFNDIITEIPNDSLETSDLDDSNFDTSVTGPDLFDESDLAIESNDVIRIKNENGDTNIGVYASAGIKEETYWKFLDANDDEIRIEADSDGTITEIKNSGDGATDDFTWELDGYYENTEDPLDEPVTDWTPSQDTDLKNFVESSNRSLRKQIWMIQGDDTDDRLISNRVVVLRGYAATNGHETSAGLTTIMQSKSYKHASLLPQIYHHHPYLIKSYLKLYEPSDIAREMLEEIDDPELNKYL